MKTTISYYASYRTTDPARPLLGGVRRATSSRFSHREDAQARLDSVIDLHARLDPPLVIDGCIATSERPADLIRHCKTVQVVGFPCPECGVIVENAAEVADGQKVSDLAEVPRAYPGEVAGVNEYGNVTGYLKTLIEAYLARAK